MNPSHDHIRYDFPYNALDNCDVADLLLPSLRLSMCAMLHNAAKGSNGTLKIATVRRQEKSDLADA